MGKNPVFASVILAVGAFVLIRPVVARAQSPITSQWPVIESAQPSLVTVTSYDARGNVIASGLGCFVRDNVVATDYLTVKDAASIKISTSRVESVTGWLFAVDQSRLLALIHPDLTKAPPLLPSEAPLAASSSISTGRQALAVTGIKNGRADLMPVVVANLSDKTTSPYLVVDAQGQHLASGGPIIDASGDIDAIVTTVKATGTAFSYAIPARILAKLVSQAVADVASSGSQLAPGGSSENSTANFAPTDMKGVKVGQAIRHVDPIYPSWARAAGITGPVKVEVAIDESGYVVNARALKGDPRLLGPAVAAAMGWRFNPSKRDGAPVKLVATLTFNFDPETQPPPAGGQEPSDISKHLQAVKADPRSEEAVLALGKAYFVKDRFEEAVRQFGTAVSLAPDDPVAFYELGSAYVGLKDYADAIGALAQAVTLKPDYLEALGLLATAYNRTEHYEEAADVCGQVLSLQSRNPDAYHNLGWAYGGLHRFQDAIDAYTTEVQIRPYYAGAHYGLGVMYASIHDFSGAILELRKAIEIDPYLAIAHSHLGMVYVALGDGASAEKELSALRPLDAALAEQLEAAIRLLPPGSK